jgi:hypothetical protein
MAIVTAIGNEAGKQHERGRKKAVPVFRFEIHVLPPCFLRG